MKINLAYWTTILTILACQTAPVNPDIQDQFVGTWFLKEWTAKLENGQINYPYGPKAYGKLVYDSKHGMTGILMADQRELFSSASVATRSPDEAILAFNSFFAYSGPYEIHPDSSYVLHHVEACSNPNWVGGTQKRYFSFEDDNLILTTPPIAVRGSENQAVEQKLVWSRE